MLKTAEQRLINKKITGLLRNGYSQVEIARLFNVSKQRINQIIKEQGLTKD